MIKDKLGNRINYIVNAKTPADESSYELVKQLNSRDGSCIWAAPCGVLSFDMPNDEVANALKVTSKTLSEPKPQRASKTEVNVGDYIYTNEELSIDCTDNDIEKQYFSTLSFNYYDLTIPTANPPLTSITPLTYKVINSMELDDHTIDLQNLNQGHLNRYESRISLADFKDEYTGGISFFNSNIQKYLRPAFSELPSSSTGIALKQYGLTITLASTQVTKKTDIPKLFTTVKELYDNGTFKTTGEVSSESSYVSITGKIKVTTEVSGSVSPYGMTLKLTLVSSTPILAMSDSKSNIELFPTDIFFQQNGSTGTTNNIFTSSNSGDYTIDSSLFGAQSNCYIERERIYTSDGATDNYNIYLCITNINRLNILKITPETLYWDLLTGEELEEFNMQLNSSSSSTNLYNNTNYRILIHSIVSGNLSTEESSFIANDFNSSKSRGLHLTYKLSFNLDQTGNQIIQTFYMSDLAVKDTILDESEE